MQSASLERIESGIRQLTLGDQLRLMERLAVHIRRRVGSGTDEHAGELIVMAQRLDVWQEVVQFEAERATGLEAIDD